MVATADYASEVISFASPATSQEQLRQRAYQHLDQMLADDKFFPGPPLSRPQINAPPPRQDTMVLSEIEGKRLSTAQEQKKMLTGLQEHASLLQQSGSKTREMVQHNGALFNDLGSTNNKEDGQQVKADAAELGELHGEVKVKREQNLAQGKACENQFEFLIEEAQRKLRSGTLSNADRDLLITAAQSYYYAQNDQKDVTRNVDSSGFGTWRSESVVGNIGANAAKLAKDKDGKDVSTASQSLYADLKVLEDIINDSEYFISKAQTSQQMAMRKLGRPLV